MTTMRALFQGYKASLIFKKIKQYNPQAKY